MNKQPLGWQSWSPINPSIIKLPLWDYPPLPLTSTSYRTIPIKPPISLWCTWHSNGTNISEDLVLSQAKKFLSHHYRPKYILVDDGWCHWGDWSSPNQTKFPSSMNKLVSNLSSLGYQTGLWIAPFLVDPKSRFASSSYHLLTHDSAGKPINAFANYPIISKLTPKYLLDITRPETMDYLKSALKTMIEDWGITLLKLDHLYAPYFHPNHDVAERGAVAITSLFEYLKNDYPHIYTISCGSAFDDVLGLADAVRISKDINSPQLFNIFKPLDHILYLARRRLLKNKLQIALTLPELRGHIDPDVAINLSDAKLYEKLYQDGKIAVFDIGYNL